MSGHLSAPFSPWGKSRAAREQCCEGGGLCRGSRCRTSPPRQPHAAPRQPSSRCMAASSPASATPLQLCPPHPTYTTASYPTMPCVLDAPSPRPHIRDSVATIFPAPSPMVKFYFPPWPRAGAHMIGRTHRHPDFQGTHWGRTPRTKPQPAWALPGPAPGSLLITITLVKSDSHGETEARDCGSGSCFRHRGSSRSQAGCYSPGCPAGFQRQRPQAGSTIEGPWWL